MNSLPGKWIEFDEVENAIDNLEMIAHCLQFQNLDKRWKWVIIAAHQALYGFAIAAIRGTDASHLIDKHNRLLGINEALERTKDKAALPWSHSIPLDITPDEEQAIKKLIKEFRNNFEHFRPQLWLIEVSGMPNIIGHIMRVIKFLALESNCITYVEESQIARIQNALEQIQQEIKFRN